jgi:hypothetical protein
MLRHVAFGEHDGFGLSAHIKKASAQQREFLHWDSELSNQFKIYIDCNPFVYSILSDCIEIVTAARVELAEPG